MKTVSIFKTVGFILLAVVFILLTFFLHPVKVVGQAASSSPQAASVSPVVVTNGWSITAFALNNLGTVVFAGRSGQDRFFADGLMLVRRNEFIRLAARGDPVPGFPDKVFLGFLTTTFDKLSGSLSLNDRDEVAFSAAFNKCPSVPQVPDECLGNGLQYGLFVYSRGKVSKVIATGDELPGPTPFSTAGTFLLADQLWFNNRGDILFSAGYSAGLFTYSAGQVQKIALENDPTPLGVPFHTADFKILFNDEGVITFSSIRGGGVFHYSGTAFIKDVAAGDAAPGGGTFLSLSGIATNGEGDIAFMATFGSRPSDVGLFLRRRDGYMIRVIADGDPSPLGGTFTLWYTATGYNRGGSYTYTVYTLVPPQLNKSGNVVFAAPVKGGTASGAVLLYSPDGIRVTAANGDPGPPQTNTNFISVATTLGYTINDLDIVTFRGGLSDGSWGVFQRVGESTRKLAVWGDVAPGAPNSSFGNNSRFNRLLQNDRGDVAFIAELCCDSSVPEGLFLSASPTTPIPNGDFELAGDTGLPANWQTVWHNSGDGDAYRYDSGGADSFKGTSVLRLHVNAGGGSTFVLSDAIPVSSDNTYLLSSWMRYSLASTDDSVLFSVLQFDSSGNVVGFDEVRGVQGENYWQWEPKHLLIHMTSVTSSVRIRFGLMSATESYLDVDAVQ